MSEPSIVATFIGAYNGDTSDRQVTNNGYVFNVTNSGTVLTSVRTDITTFPSTNTLVFRNKGNYTLKLSNSIVAFDYGAFQSDTSFRGTTGSHYDPGFTSANNTVSDKNKPDRFYVPQNVTAIPDSCFNGTYIKFFHLPSGIQTLGNNCFPGSLNSLAIPRTVTSLGNGVLSSSAWAHLLFENMTSITTFGTASTNISKPTIHIFNEHPGNPVNSGSQSYKYTWSNSGNFNTMIHSYYTNPKTVRVYDGSTTDGSSYFVTTQYTSGNGINPKFRDIDIADVGTFAAPFIYNIPITNASNILNLTGKQSWTFYPWKTCSGNLTFSSSNTAVATFANTSVSTLTIVGGGISTITVTAQDTSTAVTIAGTTQYQGSSAKAQTFDIQVDKADPTVTYTLPTNKTVLDQTPFNGILTTNSDAVPNFLSANVQVASINTNGNISIVGAGSTVITVELPSTNLFNYASNTATLTVSKGTPTLSNVPSTLSVQYGNTYQYFPTSNNTQVTSFSYTSGNTTVATISSGVITPLTIGSTVITVSQAGNTNWFATSANSNVTIIRGDPIITFNNITTTFGSTVSLAPSSTNPSGTFSFSSGNTSIVTINGSSANIVGVGSTTITATQGSSTLYNSGSATATITSSSANPTLTYSTYSKVFGDSTFTLQPTVSNSNGAISYASGNASVITINGSSASIVSAGSATITASQVASGSYNAGSATFTINVAKADPAFTSTFAVPSGKKYGDAQFSLSPPISTNLDGTFSYTSGNTSVATIAGSTVTIVGGGSSVITATQGATSNYNSKSTTATLTVSAAPNNSISNFPDLNKTFGTSNFNLQTPQSLASGAFSYSSGNTSVVSIAGNTVTIQGAGQTTITATQAADNNYASGSITANVTVAKATPSITFNLASKVYENAPFTLNPSTNSTGTFSYTSGNTSVATIDGNTVTIVGAGSSVITATQSETGNYISGNVTATLTVSKATPSIDFSDMTKTYGSSFIISRPATGSTGSFVYESLNTSIATINNNIVSVVGVGSATIRATLSSDNNYDSRVVTATLTATKANPNITFSAMNKVYGNSAFNAPISSPSTGSIQYTSSDPSVATVGLNTGLITILSIGNTTITAEQSEDSNYNTRTVTALLTVSKANPTMSNFPNINKKIGNVPFALNAPTSNSDGSINYESSNPRVATILNSMVTIVGPGTAIITAVQTATTNYNQGIITAFLIVADVDRILPNSPTPPNAAGPLVRTQRRTPTARVSGKLAMRSKKLPGSVTYYH